MKIKAGIKIILYQILGEEIEKIKEKNDSKQNIQQSKD